MTDEGKKVNGVGGRGSFHSPAKGSALPIFPIPQRQFQNWHVICVVLVSLYLTQHFQMNAAKLVHSSFIGRTFTPWLTSCSKADVWCNSPQFLRESTQNSAQIYHPTVLTAASDAD